MAFSGPISYQDKRALILEYYATGSGALSEALAISKDIVIKEVRLHLGSASTQETFSISADSGKGAPYDITLFSWDMTYDIDGNPGTVTDLVWRPDADVRLDEADEVDFAWTNTDAATWGLSVFIEEKVV